MKLIDIPEDPPNGLYLILSDADDMTDRVEVTGWTTSSSDAEWWRGRTGVRVVHAINPSFTREARQ